MALGRSGLLAALMAAISVPGTRRLPILRLPGIRQPRRSASVKWGTRGMPGAFGVVRSHASGLICQCAGCTKSAKRGGRRRGRADAAQA